MSSKNRKIFISYAHEDREFCKQLAKELREEGGFDVWIDQSDIPGGSDWAKTINEALERCTDLIAVHSEHSYSTHSKKDSYQAKGEWVHAYYHGKNIFPIKLKENIDLLPCLNQLQAIFFPEISHESQLNQLIMSIKNKSLVTPGEINPIIIGYPAHYPYFYDAGQTNLVNYIRYADDICHLSAFGHGFTVFNQATLINRLSRSDAKLRLVLAAPTTTNLQILGSWSARLNPEENIKHLRNLWVTMIEDLKMIFRHIQPNRTDAIELRVLENTLPPFSTTQFDASKDSGAIAVTFYPFHLSKEDKINYDVIARPSTIFTPKNHASMYRHFRSSFECAWEIAKEISIPDFEKEYKPKIENT